MDMGDESMKKFISFLLLILIAICFPVCAQANEAFEANFQYDSLFVGLAKPTDCDLTDDEWREYYTKQFPDIYKDIYISTRPYSWYVSQKKTKDADYNCGPACLAMILKWYNEKSDKSVDDIRSDFGFYGKGISLLQTEEYLTDRKVPFKRHEPTMEKILSALEQGSIIVVAIKVSDGYHAIIINGRYVFDEELYITYYDPGGNNKEYSINEIDTNMCMKNYCYNPVKWDDIKDNLYDSWSIIIEDPV